jgi:DNA-binding NtrC family response regulator
MSNPKTRIMFVDDDQSILATFENVFHRDRARWEMVFVRGGEEALAELARGRFDVVVSDMRMPGIDGASLLERVRAASPNTIRIMLSGSVDQREVERATGAVDVLLGKPCDTKTLRATIEHWIAVRA